MCKKDNNAYDILSEDEVDKHLTSLSPKLILDLGMEMLRYLLEKRGITFTEKEWFSPYIPLLILDEIYLKWSPQVIEDFMNEVEKESSVLFGGRI